ncbi:MAG: hypothetical protein KDD64_14945 [Bdellovibrionales bacterium]|nr:hypothetical protein [Bdellovibrionales bacterium]
MQSNLPDWEKNSPRGSSGTYRPASGSRPDREYIQSQPEPTRVNFVIASDSIDDNGSTLARLASSFRNSENAGETSIIEAYPTASSRGISGAQRAKLGTFTRLLTALGF